MDAQQFISDFLASEHGTQALQALSAQGLSADDAQQVLSQAAEAAHAHVEQQGSGLLGDHAGRSFFAAFTAGMVRGDGFLKSLVDGGEGVISGRVAASIAGNTGFNASTAATLAAAATPYLTAFLKQKFG